MIKDIGREVFVDHPTKPRSRELTCEFLANFNVVKNTIYLRGKWYLVTLKLIVDVLGLSIEDGD